MGLLNVNALKFSGLVGGAFLLSKVKPEWGQKVLCENLRQMPGVPAKFSQWLERKWQIPENSSLPIMNQIEVLSIIKNEVPHFFDQLEFISEKCWAASIGQVHQVKLKSGETLAVKVQYPGLREEVIRQVDQLLWLMEKSPAKQYGFNTDSWRNELQGMFQEELHFLNELKNQQLFYEISQQTQDDRFDSEGHEVTREPWILVPKVYPEWSSQKVLVQEWLSGKTFDEILECDFEVKKNVSIELARFLIRSLLTMPLLHGDLQVKNWAWCEEKKKIILYDFGSCVSWDSNKQRLFESLVNNLKGNRDQSPFDYLVAFGFNRDILIHINNQLPLLLENLLEPFWNQKMIKLSYWEVQSTIKKTLGDQSWYFRMAGPPWFMWLLRSFGNLFLALETLNDRISVAEIFLSEQQLLEDEMVNNNYLKTKDRWAQFNIPTQQAFVQSHSSQWLEFHHKATSLRIQVKENNEEIAMLHFPIHLIHSIEDLINDDIKVKIKDQNLDIDKIKLKALQSGLIQQDLINITKEERKIRVWIA